MIRCTFIVGLVPLLLLSSASATTNKLFVVRNFVENASLAEPKLFYIRNNLDGDIEFQDSENVSLEVHLSANKEDELDRVKIEYNLLDNETIVDIQVYIIPETTTNWPLRGGLAGAGFVVVVFAVVAMVCLYRRRRNRFKLANEAPVNEMEMRDRGKIVAEKLKTFEALKDADSKGTMSRDEEKNRKDTLNPQRQSKEIEEKIAIFDKQEPNDNGGSQGEKKCHQAKDRKVDGGKGKTDKGIKKKETSIEMLNVPTTSRNSGTPRAQSSTFVSARAAFLVLTLIVVALAISERPRARIVISVPSKFVKNGSKTFFNKDFHGRLILPKGWKKEQEYFEQFAVSEASEAISSLDPCAIPCRFACDVNVKACICRRGYEMKSGGCFDVDECKTNRNNCHVKAMCNNTIGSFQCTCKDGYWGDGVTCQACSSTPCPENFYQSEACSRTHDRKCTACTPKCEKTTYQAYGCGLTFDRKCVDISKPLTNSKAGNESDVLEVRRGSKLVVHKPGKDSILLEDRLKLDSTSATFLIGVNSTNRIRLHRNSSFFVDVEIMNVDFVPKYNDYDRAGLNENSRFASDSGFPDISSKYCRYPAPNHYSVRHVLQPDRQTQVLSATCLEHSRGLCPDYTSPGEVYYYRSLNKACDTAETSVICPKANQDDCKLEKHYSKLFCTNYTSFLNDLFGIGEDEFLDTPLQSFSNVKCANAYRACRLCRDTCSQCTESEDNPSADSCSCCYKNCLAMCAPFYKESCSQIPKKCAKGDTSQFELTMDKPSWNTRFNCFLEYEFPTSLYSLRYRVQHSSGLYSSQWVSKTLELPNHDQDSRSKIRRGTNHLDALEVSHSTNVDIPQFLYLRGQRTSNREEYKYSIESLESENTTLQRATGKAPILFQTRMPFALTTETWSDGGNCKKLSDWSQIIRQPFLNLKAANLEKLGRTATGAFSYGVRDAQYPPSLTVSISEEKSIFKYILTNASIRNDQTFHGSLFRQNTTWNAKISGYLTSCPGFLSLRVVDEVDQVEILEQDVVILCPETGFKLEVAVPRKNAEDKERLFSLFLTDAKQELKLQLALVDRGSRKGKESVENMKDDRPSPWIILMPLFVTTGCMLLALIGLMMYAQITYKEDESEKANATPGWKRVKTKKDPKKNAENDNSSKQASNKPKDPNRLKRRHLILVVFYVVVRVVYSLVFTFSMAFAILSLLHASNLEVIQGYQSLLQSKVDESNAIALKMDQHREGEIKRHLDSSDEIQRACDYFLGLQLQWLRFNMTCLIQENHLKMFNKLSTKIVEKTTEKLQQVKTKVKQRIEKFRADTNRKLQDTKERVENYGRRVYRNGWFALPRAAYKVKRAFGRKKRDVEATHSLLDNEELASATKAVTQISRSPISSRVKRNIADNEFIGFLDFVGVLDQDKLAETENNIKDKLRYLKNGLADFSDVLKRGKSPQHPLSTIMMCPLRFMAKSAKETAKEGIKRLAEEGQEWLESQSGCVLGNVSDFFAANGTESDYSYNETDAESFSERVSYEEIEDSVGSVSEMNKSSLIESVRGSSYYNVEKGDILEEMIDSQKEEILQREGRLQNVTGVYDAEVFIVTKKAVIGVLVVIDILLLIYRGTSTYKTALGLIQGFEETVEHDENEFQQEKPTVKKKVTRLLRRVLDIIALKFSQFLAFCKSLHYRIMRTNFVPLCIAIAAAAAVLYLIIVLTFNVLNVTAIEELGGYDMIAARLDSDFAFTNLAIDDHIDFINNNEMQFYRQTMNNTLGEYRSLVQDFNRDQQARMSRLNQILCSLEEDKTKCLQHRAALLDFDPETCIFPKLEGNLFEDYDGEEYRERLKRDTKAFVDAIRNIVLETIYFIIAVVLLLIIIAALSYAAFLFLKSRGMVRVKKVHVYKTLPPEILEQFKLKALDADKESNGKGEADEDKKPKKLKIDNIYLADSRQTLQGESHA